MKNFLFQDRENYCVCASCDKKAAVKSEGFKVTAVANERHRIALKSSNPQARRGFLVFLVEWVGGSWIGCNLEVVEYISRMGL